MKILVELITELEKKVNAIKNKCKKFGGDVEVVYGEKTQEVYEDVFGKTLIVNLIEVETHGVYKINGWELVATCEWKYEVGENIVRKVSGDVYFPEKYRYTNSCEHCGTNRNRINTCILYNKELNEYKQVGLTCVRDFLGISAEYYARYLSSFATLKEWLEKSSSYDYLNGLDLEFTKEHIAFSCEEIICQTIERVKRCGYISKSQGIESGTDSTSTVIYLMLNEYKDMYGKIIYPKYDVSNETLLLYNKVVEWVNSQENNDWIDNIKVCLKLNYVSNKHIGIVVSAYGCYLRDLRKKADKNTMEKSEWVGKVGERITIKAKPIVVTGFDTEFGYITIYKFIDNGNVFIWKTQSCLEDVEYMIVGTVKEFSEYDGVKQTVLTRCRVK